MVIQTTTDEAAGGAGSLLFRKESRKGNDGGPVTAKAPKAGGTLLRYQRINIRGYLRAQLRQYRKRKRGRGKGYLENNIDYEARAVGAL